MIEQGIVRLVQGNAAVAAIATAGGGFLAQLPKGQLDRAPSWTYTSVVDMPEYSLSGSSGLAMRKLQIDAFAQSPGDVVSLAAAIDAVLSGFRGGLADPDETYIDSCLRYNLRDFFDDAGRSYRRMLEYEIWFAQ